MAESDSSTGFSVQGVHRVLDDIERDLADLCHIDHIVKLRQRFYARYGEDSFDDITPWAAEVTVGRRYPFTISVGNGMLDHDLERESNRAAHASDAWARATVTQARERIKTLLSARPTYVDHAVIDLERVSTLLHTVLPSQLQRATTELSEWSGDSREAYSQFITDAGTAAANLTWALEAFRTSLAQTATVMRLGQVAMMTSLEQLAEDLDKQLRMRQDNAEGTESLISLLVLGTAVTGVLGALDFPHAGAVAITSALLGLVKDTIPENERHVDERTLREAGSYATALHSAIGMNLNNIWTKWDTAHSIGAKKIRSEERHLATNSAGLAFEPRIPAAADRAPQLGDFTRPGLPE